MWVKGEYFDDFDTAEIAARGVLDRATQPLLFDRLSWFRRIWTHCAPGIRPLIARAVSEKAQAWLFFTRRADGTLTALASWYTLAFRPVFVNADDDFLKLRLLTAIARRLRGALKIESIALAPVPVEDGTATLMERAFKRAGWAVSRCPATVNWIADVSGQSFGDYWADRPGELRSTVSRKAAKTAFDFEIIERYDTFSWNMYESIYESSWKPYEGSPAFLRSMAEEEGAAGALRLGIARLGERPVAAQFWTVENGTAIIHKLAYVKDAAEHSPGPLVSAAMFEHVLDRDRVSLIDYGTGNDSYKANWMDRARPLDQIAIFNPATLAGFTGAARAKIANLVRKPRVD